MNRYSFITIIILAQLVSFAEAKSLEEVLALAYKANPEIQSSEYELEAEKSLVGAKATLDDPVVGFSTLKRNMRTKYISISQKIEFPAKYILEAKAQKSHAKSFESKLRLKMLEIREQVVSLYYGLYSIQKIIQLTKSNMQAVREFARIAEKKYAAGNSSQGDSMKAHFELTQLEVELIKLNQQEQALQSQMKAVVGDSSWDDLDLNLQKLTVPKFKRTLIHDNVDGLSKQLKESSPKIKSESHKFKAAQFMSSSAKWEFAPDVQLQYQQRISGDPEDSKIYSVGLSIPLWFWKKGAMASAASSRKLAQKFRLEGTTLKLIANIKDLIGKVETGSKTLKIYETSLIPQAQGAFNSTRASYRASKTTFLDLLDSERSLYKVKSGFYKTLQQYIKNLSQLEKQIGFSVSNLAIKVGK